MSLIVFEDEHLLVVDKPAGWNTHAPSPFAGEGIYDWLKHREPRWSKLAIIHRLDKETSGVLVFGKTPAANKSLTEQFASRAVKKKYVLLTDRAVARKDFAAASTIVRAGEKYVSRPIGAGGEHAETRFSVIGADGSNTAVRAEPITGRTHQIRVHAAEHGFPILGDVLYGGTNADRVFLHAEEISFSHPVTVEPLTFRAMAEWSDLPPESWPADSGAWDCSTVRSGRMPGARLRAAVVDPNATDAFRLVHGAGDGRPGLHVERFGDFLLAETAQPLTAAQRELIEQLARAHASRGVYHKLLDRNVRRSNTTDSSPRLLFGDAAPEKFVVRENGLNFEISFCEGYSVGLFLDQRDNRRRFLVNHIGSGFSLFSPGGSPPEVLNTFAYTCGFSVAAAKAGARTTSLDLSKKYLEWGKRNFALNGIDAARHDFIYGDAFDWMRRLAKKGRAFDGIVLDPPTFSQSKEGGTWQAEKHYGRLVDAALPLLKSNGVLLASTNAAKLEPERFVESIRNSVSQARRNILQEHYVPQPPDFPVTRAEPAYLKTFWLRVS